MTNTLSTADFVSQFQALLDGPIPADIELHLRHILVDTIAIADHARRYQVGGCGLDDIEEPSSGHAEIWGTNRTEGPLRAAFLNGNAAETLDFQEVLIDGRNNGHSAVIIIPTLIALDSKAPASDDRLLRCLWIAFAANCLLARALGRGHRTNGPGFRTTSLTAPVAAALAGGFLVGGVETAIHSCALAAANLHAGLLASLAPVGGSFSVDKDLAVGMSARHATLCTLLAANGATGPATAITGYGSWLNSFGFDTADAAHLRIDPKTVDLSAYALKYYPTSFGSHAAISIALDMGAELALSDIETIDLHVKTSSVKNAITGTPATHIAARFSLVYAVATTLFNKRCTLENFDDDALHDPGVLAILDKITLQDVPAYEERHLSEGVFPCRMVITKRDGSSLEDTRMGPLDNWTKTRVDAAFSSKIQSLSQPATAEKLLSLASCQHQETSLDGVHSIFSTEGDET